MKRAKWMQFGFSWPHTCLTWRLSKRWSPLELSAAQCRELAPESTVHKISRDLIMIDLPFQQSSGLLPSEAASESKKLVVTSSKATSDANLKWYSLFHEMSSVIRWFVRVDHSAVYKNHASRETWNNFSIFPLPSKACRCAFKRSLRTCLPDIKRCFFQRVFLPNESQC